MPRPPLRFCTLPLTRTPSGGNLGFSTQVPPALNSSVVCPTAAGGGLPQGPTEGWVSHNPTILLAGTDRPPVRAGLFCCALAVALAMVSAASSERCKDLFMVHSCQRLVT